MGEGTTSGGAEASREMEEQMGIKSRREEGKGRDKDKLKEKEKESDEGKTKGIIILYMYLNIQNFRNNQSL